MDLNRREVIMLGGVAVSVLTMPTRSHSDPASDTAEIRPAKKDRIVMICSRGGQDRYDFDEDNTYGAVIALSKSDPDASALQVFQETPPNTTPQYTELAHTHYINRGFRRDGSSEARAKFKTGNGGVNFVSYGTDLTSEHFDFVVFGNPLSPLNDQAERNKLAEWVRGTKNNLTEENAGRWIVQMVHMEMDGEPGVDDFVVGLSEMLPDAEVDLIVTQRSTASIMKEIAKLGKRR